MYLSNADNPLSNITTLLNRGNFISLSITINTTLGAKNKQVFIDGTCKKPNF